MTLESAVRNANLITCNSDLTWNGALRCRSKRSHARKGFTHPTFALYLIHIPKDLFLACLPKQPYHGVDCGILVMIGLILARVV